MSGETPVQPRAGIGFFVLPVVLIPLVVLGYVVLVVLGLRGTPAEGPRVTFTLATCPEARPALEARIAAMGLGDPEIAATDGRVTVTATMPADPGVARRIPETLARRGRFDVVEDGASVVGPGQVREASVRIDFIGEPSVAIQLTDEATEALEAWMDAHPEGQVTLRIDGEAMGDRANTPAERGGKLTVRITDDDRARQIERVAAAAVVVNDPLPCDAEVLAPSGDDG